MLFFAEGVEETGFADVGATDEGDGDAGRSGFFWAGWRKMVENCGF